MSSTVPSFGSFWKKKEEPVSNVGLITVKREEAAGVLGTFMDQGSMSSIVLFMEFVSTSSVTLSFMDPIFYGLSGGGTTKNTMAMPVEMFKSLYRPCTSEELKIFEQATSGAGK